MQVPPEAPVMQMMNVICPPTATGGHQILLDVGGGQHMHVVVPAGVGPGSFNSHQARSIERQ